LSILDTITELSHEFGTIDFVRGGGGNTSCKDDQTLWVKPSGSTLEGLTPELFVILDRARLAELYAIDPPADSTAREALVKEMMEKAATPESKGRASVEAPLHDSLNARYVVHTHPFTVNGMTCGNKAKAVCAELFPDALWLDYIDPGYTLCMQVRSEIDDYKAKNGYEPSILFLKNHGVFVAADEAEDVRSLYATVMSKLKAFYGQAGIATDLEFAPLPGDAEIAACKKLICDAMQNENLHIATSGTFETPAGPITPDHLVYSRASFFVGVPTQELVEDFKSKNGYAPKVFVFNDAVFGVTENEATASLALELAQDAALVEQLAEAFGGVDHMSAAGREFIENWEVESYRKKQA
jgi:rhamnose utilization protein RhaD (predicted bifunctional aldolase and dehydrogenase)